jgi:hypothetical protein
MQQFFAKTKDVQMYMSEIRHRQHELWQMHEQSKTLVRRQEITPHRERMQVRSGNLALLALGSWVRIGFPTIVGHSTYSPALTATAALEAQLASVLGCCSSRVSRVTSTASLCLWAHGGATLNIDTPAVRAQHPWPWAHSSRCSLQAQPSSNSRPASYMLCAGPGVATQHASCVLTLCVVVFLDAFQA